MPIGTSLAIGLGALSMGGKVAKAAIGSRAAGKASKLQYNAANRAAELQAQYAREALDFQKQQYQTTQQNFAPWLGVGQGSLANLSNLMGIQAPQAGPATGGLAPTQGGQAGGSFNTIARGGTPGRGTTLPMMSPAGGGPERWEYDRSPGGPWDPRQAAADSMGSSPMVNQPQMAAPGPTGASTAMVPQGGQVDLNSLVNPNLGASGSLMQDFGREFEAPTEATMQQEPGFQFRLQEGLDALQNSAAARGGLLTGATAEALTRYGQDYASGEYGNVYDRASREYERAYNIFEQNQAKKFNRLSSMSGMGQVAAGQLGSLGQSAAGNVGNILMGSAGQIGNSLQNAAAARASGYTDSASQWGGALQSGTSGMIDLVLLSQLGKDKTEQDKYGLKEFLGKG